MAGRADYGAGWNLSFYGVPPPSVPEGFQRASGKPFGAPAGAYPCPGWGLTRRLRRGWWGCRPEGDSTFFRRERKYQRKHAARRLREKGFYCPFWRRGSQCRAQTSWRANSSYRARSCSLFSSFKKGKAFSLRCLSPLVSPAVGAGQTQRKASWDVTVWLG